MPAFLLTKSRPQITRLASPTSLPTQFTLFLPGARVTTHEFLL